MCNIIRMCEFWTREKQKIKPCNIHIYAEDTQNTTHVQVLTLSSPSTAAPTAVWGWSSPSPPPPGAPGQPVSSPAAETPQKTKGAIIANVRFTTVLSCLVYITDTVKLLLFQMKRGSTSKHLMWALGPLFPGLLHFTFPSSISCIVWGRAGNEARQLGPWNLQAKVMSTTLYTIKVCAINQYSCKYVAWTMMWY